MSTRSKNTRTKSPAAKKQKTDKAAKWTDEEHEAFLEGYKKHGDDWKKIAAKIKTRTMTQTRTYGQKYEEEQAEKDKEEATPRKPRGRASKAKSTPKKDEKKSPRGRRSKRQKEETEEEEEEAEPEVEDKDEESSEAKGEEEVKEPKKEAAAPKKDSEKKKAEKKEPPKKKAKKSAAEKAAATPSKTSEGGTKVPAPQAQNALQLPLTPGVPPTSGALPTPGSPSNFYTDRDILLPMNESVTSRPANREYLELLKANCVIFHSLPTAEQAWFVRNFCHFITTVRGRRWIGFHHFSGYRPLLEPLPAVAAEFRLDPLKRAAFQFHPLWLVGEHDPGNIHKGKPFVHRKVDGAWRSASVKDVREILTAEGSKNLLLLPPSIKMDDPKPKDDKAEEKSEAKKPATDESGKKTTVV